MNTYAVIPKGTADFHHDTVVEIISFEDTDGSIEAKRLTNGELVELPGIEGLLPVERVSKLKVDAGRVKQGSLFYETSFSEHTNEVGGYDSHGHYAVVDVDDVESVGENE